MRKRQKLWGMCLLFGMVMTIGGMGVRKQCKPYGDEEILFSLEKSFYSEDQELILSTLLESEIYYTEDGSLPTREAKRYDGPIKLQAEEEPRAIPIRAVAYYGEGATSDIYTKTYFLGSGIQEQFSTRIVSITADPEVLYDYDRGILVAGRLRDDYAMANPGEEFTDRAPANYNLRGRESERPVHVEIYEPDGTRIVSQNMGLRAHGGASRGSDMKSLRLIARKVYGKSRISYELFSEEQSDYNGQGIGEYKELVLRNHGNDQEQAYLRNELGQRLAKDAGFLDTQEFCCASVWLNGEYYGFEWMEEAYDDDYFHVHYGTKKQEGSWSVLSPHRGMIETDVEDEADRQAAVDLKRVYDYQFRDLTEDEVFTQLKQKLDVDNFLRYCAIEIYLSNPDWPDNNCKAYRWYSETESSNPYNSYTDGRWRFLLYDLDMGMARTDSSMAGNPSLGEVLGEEESQWDRREYLLCALLQREDMRQRFTEMMEELMANAFSYTHVCEVIEEIQKEMESELDFHMRRLAREEAEDFSGEKEAYLYQKAVYGEEIEKIKEFFRLRPEVMREELKRISSPSPE